MATQAVGGYAIIDEVLRVLGLPGIDTQLQSLGLHRSSIPDLACKVVLWVPLEGPIHIEVTYNNGDVIDNLFAVDNGKVLALFYALGFPVGSEIRDLKLVVAVDDVVHLTVNRLPSRNQLDAAVNCLREFRTS